jgi:hypothetical protein
MSKTSPIPHPEWNEMLEKQDAFRSQIAAVLTDLHSLADSKEVIIGRYAAAFSTRLNQLHQAEIDAARLKREIELVQAAINSGQEVDYEQIHAILEAEFAEWQARITDELDDLTHHWGMLEYVLDPEKTRKLRRMYRMLARRLHPDLNPSQSPAQAELWHRVTAAYQTQDLDELDALELLTRDVDSAPVPDSMEALQETLKKLRDQLNLLLVRFGRHRKEWPFDQLPLLDDPAAVAARQAELDERITATEAMRDERKHWLNQILDHGTP